MSHHMSVTQKISKQTSQHSLMSDNKDRSFRTFDLEYDRLESIDHIEIGLTLWVAISELVTLTRG